MAYPRLFRPMPEWLAALCRPPCTRAESFLRWAADFGAPATDAEYRDALASGLIPPPESLES